MQRKNTITTKDKLKKRRKESLWDQGTLLNGTDRSNDCPSSDKNSLIKKEMLPKYYNIRSLFVFCQSFQHHSLKRTWLPLATYGYFNNKMCLVNMKNKHRKKFNHTSKSFIKDIPYENICI